MRSAAAASTTLDDVEVECTHCGVTMSTHLGSGTRVRYFRCGSCLRWVSSTYTDVFRYDTKVRRRPKPEAAGRGGFDAVRNRLERWLSALDDQDPYRMLGVSPLDPPDAIRDRYRELAFANHPDRGGSAEKMRELNDAYDRITQHSERRRTEALSLATSAGQLAAGN